MAVHIETADASGRVIAVSRFSDDAQRRQRDAWGVETIVGDLLDPRFVDTLPDAISVVFMAGMKFGSTGSGVKEPLDSRGF